MLLAIILGAIKNDATSIETRSPNNFFDRFFGIFEL